MAIQVDLTDIVMAGGEMAFYYPAIGTLLRGLSGRKRLKKKLWVFVLGVVESLYL